MLQTYYYENNIEEPRIACSIVCNTMYKLRAAKAHGPANSTTAAGPAYGTRIVTGEIPLRLV